MDLRSDRHKRAGPSPGPTPRSPRPAVPPPETSPPIRWRSGSSPAWPTAEPADEQRAVSVAGQPQRHVQGVDTVPTAAARHEERPDVGDRPATGLEGPLGGGIRHAIAAGLPGPRVEPIMT